MKPFLVCITAILLLSALGGCAHRKSKSRVKLYEGDSSPHIKMFEERPGYGLNPM